MEELEASRSLKRGADYDLGLCVICQKKQRKSKSENFDPVKPIPESSLDNLKKSAERWKTKASTKFSNAIAIIDAEFAHSDKPELLWHRDTCRPDFTSNSKINRVPDLPAYQSNDFAATNAPFLSDDRPDLSMPTTTRLLRSQVPSYSEADCIFCCMGEEEGELHRCSSYVTDSVLNHLAKNDQAIKIRLQRAFDSMAGDVQYHRSCLTGAKRRAGANINLKPEGSSVSYDDCLFELVKELRVKIDRGCAVLLGDCWERLQTICTMNDVLIPTR